MIAIAGFLMWFGRCAKRELQLPRADDRGIYLLTHIGLFVGHKGSVGIKFPNS